MVTTQQISEGIENLFSSGVTGASIAGGVNSQLPGRTDGPSDAYRHMLLGAEWTRRFGAADANYYLNNHEEGEIGDGSQMDLYNNAKAVQIGEYVRAHKGSWQDLKALVNE